MKTTLTHILNPNAMKILFRSIVAVCCIVGYSCNKDQKLVSEIAGEYKIESIINYNGGKSTSLHFTTGSIYFQNCTMKEGVGGNCTGWYVIDGLAQVTFQFVTKNDNGNKTLMINNPSSFKEPVIRGYYEFEKNGDVLLLNGIAGSVGTRNGVSFSDYSVIKLSEK